jgi:DNA repair protein RAD7
VNTAPAVPESTFIAQQARGRQTAEKIKAAKMAKKRKQAPDSGDEDADIANAIMESRPTPGQIDHCDICGQRFTVTPYSRAGPNGGLLCAACGRNVGKDNKPEIKKPKKAYGLGKKRKIQSSILDRTFRLGAKDLATLCVETLAKNVDVADSLGDLPEHLVDKAARLFSKRRLLNPKTVMLFVQPSTESLKIYEGAYLGGDDIIQCFQIPKNLRIFKIRNGILFKDRVLDYLATRDYNLESFSVHGANLLSDQAWTNFLSKKGQFLQTLWVKFTDKYFGDDMVAFLGEKCPNLKRLGICHNQKLTEEGVELIANLRQLETLSLHLQNSVSNRTFRRLIGAIGVQLKSLSLRGFTTIDDDVLDAIHDNCASLVKLRIQESSHVTDKGFISLFTNWANPPLEVIDFSKCRHLDSTVPRDPDSGIGLCSNGFRALMKHSGSHLRRLNIESCRYITAETFLEVFNGETTYPALECLEVAFCEEVTDEIIALMYRCCPLLREIVVCGCMKVLGRLPVPRGRLLIGVPNVMGMIIEGTG